MNEARHEEILAKSSTYGGENLWSHTHGVLLMATLIGNALHYDERAVSYGAILHDLGKISPIFQKRLKSNTSSFNSDIPYRHEIASLFFLKTIPKEYWSVVIDMIVAHHKSIARDLRELGILDLVYNYGEDEIFNYHATDFNKWKEIALDILEDFGIGRISLTKRDAYDSFMYVVEYLDNQHIYGWSDTKGLLMGADHLASAISPHYEEINALFQSPDISFYNRQSALYPLSLISSDNTKKHTFLKAPTGTGKTDFMIKRCRGRIFYTLPFQASINAMYQRIIGDLGPKGKDIRILHAVSKLEVSGTRLIEREIQDKIGAAIKVMTPHQIASIVFGTKGYESVLLDLKGADIILDEIHTYSNVFQSIVLKIIEILVANDCHIHIGTATMPTVLENKILMLLGVSQTQYVSLPEDVLSQFDRHVVYKGSAWHDFEDKISNALANKEKVLFVCNQVKRAQQLYLELEEQYPSIRKMLLHSRFKRGRRKELEGQLKADYNESKEACIVVSTQVVEVSLDISFDLMITECAPIDAMIQRFGRINRKRTGLMQALKPVCVIKPPETDNDCLPYQKDILLKSFEVLPEASTLHEKKLQSLIDQVYPEITSPDIDLDSVYQDGNWKLKKLCHNPKSVLLEKLDIDSVICILYSDRESYLTATPDNKMFEIPMSYRSLRWQMLDTIHHDGRSPFLIPDEAYSNEMGLDLTLLKKNNVENQIL